MELRATVNKRVHDVVWTHCSAYRQAVFIPLISPVGRRYEQRVRRIGTQLQIVRTDDRFPRTRIYETESNWSGNAAALIQVGQRSVVQTGYRRRDPVISFT